MPDEIKLEIFRHLLHFNESIHIFVSGHAAGSPAFYFIEPPSYAYRKGVRNKQNGFDDGFHGYSITSRNVRTFDRFPQLSPITNEVFYGSNTFEAFRDRDSERRVPFVAGTFLSQIGPGGRQRLRKLIMHLNFNKRQREELPAAVRMLYQNFDPQGTIYVDIDDLEPEELSHPELVPGVAQLGYIRGGSNLNIVFSQKWPEGEAWIARRHMPRHTNTGCAIFDQIPTPATLARRPGLLEMAKDYGYDTAAQQFPNGESPVEKGKFSKARLAVLVNERLCWERDGNSAGIWRGVVNNQSGASTAATSSGSEQINQGQIVAAPNSHAAAPQLLLGSSSSLQAPNNAQGDSSNSKRKGPSTDEDGVEAKRPKSD